MTFTIFNSLTRRLEPFASIRPGEVSMYCCGPTVYNYLHIGNLRCFCFYDLLRRYLKFSGYKVRHVMNITDVDDKTIRDSRKEGKSLKEFTAFYTKIFLDDLRTLNIEVPELLPHATDEIDSMVRMIQKLLAGGHAYKTARGDIYFRISSFASYGQLANIDLSKVKTNAEGRLNDEYDKESLADFALWKAWDDSDGDAYWDTELGRGRPGWHIECSAMSEKYLGQPFDIHCGGVDLIFPHHTNEIAQSECALGKKFVNYWMHNAHLFVDGKKMSKSLGNYYVLKDLLDKGLKPAAIRYEFIKSHYRQQIDFRIDNFPQNMQIINKFEEFLARLDRAEAPQNWSGLDSVLTQARSSFIAAMDDDLNISEGFSAIFSFMNTVNKSLDMLSIDDAKKVRTLMTDFDSVLGIIPAPSHTQDAQVEELIAQRNAARKNKDFKRADQIRDQLQALGVVIKDSVDGTVWRKI